MPSSNIEFWKDYFKKYSVAELKSLKDDLIDDMKAKDEKLAAVKWLLEKNNAT